MKKINLDKPRTLPEVKKREVSVDAQGYRSELQHLRFSNGKYRTFRRSISRGRGAVLAIPVIDADNVLLIREYCAGMERYEWALPKGHIEANETPEEAAMRECREEVGYSARKVDLLKAVSLSPGYMTHMTHIVLLQDLYESPLVGDEPEPIEVCPFPFRNLAHLVLRADVSEARSLFALYYARELLHSNSGS